jgi:hypothetical protein
MRILIRLIGLACVAVCIGQAWALRAATAGGLFTQFPDPALAKMQAAKPQGDAFAGLGMDDLAGAPVKVDNEFRLGLLPAGPGHGLADAASVLTLGGPSLVLLVLTWWATRRPRAAKA